MDQFDRMSLNVNEHFGEAAPRDGNLVLGVLAGTLAGAIGAGLWAMVASLTGYEIGWLAVGVGALVGFAMRTFGQGHSAAFGIAGAGLSLLGCAVGRLLAVCVVVAQHFEVPVSEVWANIDAAQVFAETFSPVDLIFIFIALSVGYRASMIAEGEAG
jgi:hypothetical protein